MKTYAHFQGYIVTANADGSIPLNARMVCGAASANETELDALLAQANVAPELLAALELILGNASAQRGSDTDFAAWHRLRACEIGALLTEARAAVNKAKGIE